MKTGPYLSESVPTDGGSSIRALGHEEGHGWADARAKEVVQYLRKCSNEAEELELIAAALRCERSRGAMIGVRDVGKAMGIETTSV